MDPQIMSAIIGASAGFLGAVLGTVVSALVQSALASKQRKHEQQIAQKERQQGLRMAAIETRLEKHQQASSWVSEILLAAIGLDNEAAVQLVKQFTTWWNSNSLYLQPQVKESYKDWLLSIPRDAERDLASGIEEDPERTVRFLQEIQRAIVLPPVTTTDILASSDRDTESR